MTIPKPLKREVNILVAEGDSGHTALIRESLTQVGITNPIIEFKDGRELLEFLFKTKESGDPAGLRSYLLLLDLKMPRLDAMEALRRLKADDQLKTMPVIVIADPDGQAEIDECRRLGYDSHITKPVQYDAFVEAIKKLGLFLMIVEAPAINLSVNIGE